MQGWLKPIGPEDPRIYWIRRAVVLVVIFAVIAAIVWLAVRPRSVTATPVESSPSNSATASPDAETPQPSPSESPSEASDGEPTPGAETTEATEAESADSAGADSSETPDAAEQAPAACQPKNLSLRVEGNEALAQSETSSAFHVAVATTEESCRLDLGAAGTALAITSGADAIWSTADCDQWQPSDVLELTAGAESGFDVSWPVRRSNGCEITESVLGVGTYVATATIEQASARFVMQIHY